MPVSRDIISKRQCLKTSFQNDSVSKHQWSRDFILNDKESDFISEKAPFLVVFMFRFLILKILTKYGSSVGEKK